ncbi:unnamed protein product [Coregonus sp. 'balchen']|nr:unnamed protein product [Coregonus sp. 'balchen']
MTLNANNKYVITADHNENIRRSAVAGSPGGRHVTVQCERSAFSSQTTIFSNVYPVAEEQLVPSSSWKCNSESPELKRVTETLQPHWEARQVSAGLESRFQHQYKVSFDNMASYREKKKQRLQQQNEHWGKKRGPGNGQQSNAASKKAKKGNKSEPVLHASS